MSREKRMAMRGSMRSIAAPASASVVTRSARIIREGGVIGLDLRPLLLSASERAARLAVDRLVHGRHDACQRIVKAAERMGEACRFAAAYLTSLLTVGDLDSLDIRWSDADLLEHLLVAADRLMAKGNEAGDMLALALGPWSAGDWRGADKYIAHLNAQPRLYNIEASADGIFARGLVVRAEGASLPMIGWSSDGSNHAPRRSVYVTTMQMRVHDHASWHALAHARRLASVRIAGHDVCHVYLNCSLDDVMFEANMLSITLTHDNPSIVGDPWAVAGDVIAMEMWR